MGEARATSSHFLATRWLRAQRLNGNEQRSDPCRRAIVRGEPPAESPPDATEEQRNHAPIIT
jgi:hypothetical protein